jgi:hypothetical protein
MDTSLYAEVLIARCSVLLGHYHRSGDRTDTTELRDEFRWLAADARLWGVRPEAVADGVLAELLRHHGPKIAHALQAHLEAAFWLEPTAT